MVIKVTKFTFSLGWKKQFSHVIITSAQVRTSSIISISQVEMELFY